MALRLVQIVLPKRHDVEVREVIGRRDASTLWVEPAADDRIRVSVLLPKEECDDLVQRIDGQYSAVEGYRLVLAAIEGTRPKIEEPAEPKAGEDGEDEAPRRRKPFFGSRVASDELVQEVASGAKLTRVYVAMVVLSAVVAAAGLIQGSAAVIIGAMVIAPLLGPNMALALALTIGDLKLARRALLTNFVGFVVAGGLAAGIGVLAQADPQSPEIAARVSPKATDIAIALAAGAAGTLAATTGVPAILVGVMVAVALMPPLVTSGLLLASAAAEPVQALGALLLAILNVICINASAMAMFRLQGVAPYSLYDERRARRSSTYAILCWGLLLAALTAIVLLWSRGVQPHADG
ncbi:MAG: TIGR00341 family protein [Planctomycetota bacterium]